MVAVLFRHILLAGWLVPRILRTVMDLAGFRRRTVMFVQQKVPMSISAF